MTTKQYKKSEDLLVKAWRIVLREESQLMQHIRNAFTGLYNVTGKPKKLESILKKELAVCEKTLGDNDPLTLKVRMNLVTLYNNNNRYQDSERTLKTLYTSGKKGKQARQLRKEDALRVYSLTAHKLKRQKKYHEELKVHEEMYALCKREYGPEHIQTGTVLLGLIDANIRVGNFKGLDRQYQFALKIYEKTNGIKGIGLDRPLREYIDFAKRTGQLKKVRKLEARLRSVRAARDRKFPSISRKSISMSQPR